MSFEDYEKICINLKNLGFWGRVSPYLMNEPLMDKDRMPKFIEITKKHLNSIDSKEYFTLRLDKKYSEYENILKKILYTAKKRR